MIEAKEFFYYLSKLNFGPFIGVPCSLLKPLINYAIESNELDYIISNNEGEALSIAAGAYLSGKRPVVMLQNSGLGNMVNPLTSLNYIFKIPVLLIVTWRGEPGFTDEPQHKLMGKITDKLLKIMDIESMLFPQDSSQIISIVDKCVNIMENTHMPTALIMRKDSVKPNLIKLYQEYSFSRGELISSIKTETPTLTRREAISFISKATNENTAIIATTGMISRELFYSCDRHGNFYVVGSMGCASSISLGVALYKPKSKVVVLDGDGAALMRLESMASIGYYHPKNFIHVILDNMTYGSTGGQATQANALNFDEIAIACGYDSAISLVTREELETAICRCLKTDGPHLIHIRVLPGNDKSIGRPTLSPEEIKSRFIKFLKNMN